MKPLRPSRFSLRNSSVMRVSPISSGIQLREVFPVNVDIFVAAAGEIDDEDFALCRGREAHGFGDGVRRLERGYQAFGAGKAAGCFERLLVADRDVLGASHLAPERGLPSHPRLIYSRRDGGGKR